MMLVVAKLMMQGQFPIGDFSMFVCYLGTFASCVERVTELITVTKQAEVSYDRMVDLVGEENEKVLRSYHNLKAFKSLEKFEYKEMGRTPLKEFKVKNLSYSYDKNNAIHGIDFSVKPGEIVVMSGSVGSGKSTILDVLTGIIQKDSGQMFWNGNEIKNHRDFLIPPNVAYSPQISRMFNDTIRENLLLGRDATQVEINEALYNAVFEGDFIEKEGIEMEIGSQGNKLSGGQKQRLGMARMFIHNAELYIMDDSSSAIDNETEKELWKRFEENINKKKFACIIASNKKNILQRADRVIFLKNGRIVDSGKADELANRCKDFASIYAS